MDKAALVRTDVDKGPAIISTLDNAGFKVNVALWASFADYEEPRLVLASRALDEEGPLNAYGVALDALKKHNISVNWGPPLLILRMTDPFIKDLRRIFSRTESVEGMRLGGQSFGGRYLLDAYVYRIK